MKNLFKNLSLALLSVIFTFTAIEIILRFFPVADTVPRMPMNKTQILAKFYPNEEVTYSLGWNFYQVSHKRTNNDGFYNDLNYKTNPDKPVIAVIGDSFVEAMQVDNNETFFELLQKDFPQYYFYSFGASGAQLPTYLTFAKYAVSKYHAKKLIFVIINNDFDESFWEYKVYPGFQYFTKDGKIYTVYYQPSIIRRTLRHFALVRYLFFNLQINRIIWQLEQKVAYENKTKEKKRIVDAKKAVDIFFELLRKEIKLPHKDIIFVVDAPRELIYKNELNEVKKTYFGILRNYFMEKAKKDGYTVIDMLPIFVDYYRKYHKRYEFPTDAHWNEWGHYVVFQTLQKLLNSEKSF